MHQAGFWVQAVKAKAAKAEKQLSSVDREDSGSKKQLKQLRIDKQVSHLQHRYSACCKQPANTGHQLSNDDMKAAAWCACSALANKHPRLSMQDEVREGSSCCD